MVIQFAQRDDLPLTSTGKINRAELRKQGHKRNKTMADQSHSQSEALHGSSLPTDQSACAERPPYPSVSGQHAMDQHVQGEMRMDELRIISLVNGSIAELLGERFVGMQAPLELSSVNALQLVGVLSNSTGLQLPALLAFNFPTGDSIVKHVLQLEATHSAEHLYGLTSVDDPLAQSAVMFDDDKETHAFPSAELTAISLRGPTHTVDDQNQAHASGVWHMLVHDPFWDCMSCMPADRGGQDLQALYHPIPGQGDVYVQYARYMANVFSVDTTYFSLSSVDAMHTDPQQRVLLQHADAVLSADLRTGNSKQVGVFVGCMTAEWSQILADNRMDRAIQTETGNSLAFMAGIISFMYGLTGPCLGTNTACSSSLVALHMALMSVHAGESVDGAVAGGVGLSLTSHTVSRICLLQALSRDGCCKTFDELADGYGRGKCEGVMLASVTLITCAKNTAK